ncbi:MAG: type II secretion system protein [Thermoleophilia bacterium]|nr:type II secretion system protein [Thermoleophilia bacterium]
MIGQQGHTLGYTILELLVVLAILSLCLVVMALSLVPGLKGREARGAAQTWQAAVAWAQIDVLWQGASTAASWENSDFQTQGVRLVPADDPFSLTTAASLDVACPAAPVSTNVGRWRTDGGLFLTLTAPLATPSSGGSVFFGDESISYRVTIRPESGLTTRSRVAQAP